MNFSRILIPVGVIVFVAAAWHEYKWPGVAVATGAVVMWILLHFTRMVTVLSRAANRPVGHVDSAVMLNVKLKKGVNLMHVIAMTKSLGVRLFCHLHIQSWQATGMGDDAAFARRS
jgi:hypothetical protein